MDYSTAHLVFKYTDGTLYWSGDYAPRARRGQVAGKPNKKGYTNIGWKHKSYLAHRIIWLMHSGKWPTHDIDHIDRNPRNNRIENLRHVTRSQNKMNMGAKADNKIGIKGVNRKRGRWVAQIQKDGKKTHLGYFGTPEEAGAAYKAAAKIIHGVYAPLS